MPAKLVKKQTWVQGIHDRLIGGPCPFPVGDNCEITKYTCKYTTFKNHLQNYMYVKKPISAPNDKKHLLAKGI